MLVDFYLGGYNSQKFFDTLGFHRSCVNKHRQLHTTTKLTRKEGLVRTFRGKSNRKKGCSSLQPLSEASFWEFKDYCNLLSASCGSQMFAQFWRLCPQPRQTVQRAAPRLLLQSRTTWPSSWQ